MPRTPKQPKDWPPLPVRLSLTVPPKRLSPCCLAMTPATRASDDLRSGGEGRGGASCCAAWIRCGSPQPLLHAAAAACRPAGARRARAGQGRGWGWGQARQAPRQQSPPPQRRQAGRQAGRHHPPRPYLPPPPGQPQRGKAHGAPVHVDDVVAALHRGLGRDGRSDGGVSQDAVVQLRAVVVHGLRDARRRLAAGAGVGGEEAQVQAARLAQAHVTLRGGALAGEVGLGAGRRRATQRSTGACSAGGALVPGAPQLRKRAGPAARPPWQQGPLTVTQGPTTHLLEHVRAADQLVQAPAAQLGQARPHLLRHKVEVVDEVGGRAWGSGGWGLGSSQG
jgi:hypothetical protein